MKVKEVKLLAMWHGNWSVRRSDHGGGRVCYPVGTTLLKTHHLVAERPPGAWGHAPHTLDPPLVWDACPHVSGERVVYMWIIPRTVDVGPQVPASG
jgi:hypothetical protein